jgi:hypothetical protein
MRASMRAEGHETTLQLSLVNQHCRRIQRRHVRFQTVNPLLSKTSQIFCSLFLLTRPPICLLPGTAQQRSRQTTQQNAARLWSFAQCEHSYTTTSSCSRSATVRHSTSSSTAQRAFVAITGSGGESDHSILPKQLAYDSLQSSLPCMQRRMACQMGGVLWAAVRSLLLVCLFCVQEGAAAATADAAADRYAFAGSAVFAGHLA